MKTKNKVAILGIIVQVAGLIYGIVNNAEDVIVICLIFLFISTFPLFDKKKQLEFFLIVVMLDFIFELITEIIIDKISRKTWIYILLGLGLGLFFIWLIFSKQLTTPLKLPFYVNSTVSLLPINSFLASFFVNQDSLMS